MTKSYFIFLNLATLTLSFFGIGLPSYALEYFYEIDEFIIKLPATQFSIFNSKLIEIAQDYNDRSITVFGRTNCSITQKLIGELESRKIPYTFKNVEIEARTNAMDGNL